MATAKKLAAKKDPAKEPAKKKPAKKKSVVRRAKELLGKLLPSRKKTPAKPKKKPAKRGKRLLPAAEATEIAHRLAVTMPEPGHELSFRTPFELLIATILAAQSTDRTVNQVMPTLLARFPGPHELAAAGQDEVEILVKRTGFFRNKARAIRETAQQLVERHGGEVPDTMEALVALPGVARKTANVVLGTAHRINAGFVVDTHVARVTQRLRLTNQTQPERVEEDLCRAYEQTVWTDLGHRFTLHGRYTCLAKRPLCSDCPLNELCLSRESEPSDSWEQRSVREHARVRDGIDLSQRVPA